jgi:hypothetical protein
VTPRSVRQAFAKSSYSIPPQPNYVNIRATCPFPSSAIPTRRYTAASGVEASAKAVLNPRAWRALPVGWRRAIADAVAHRRAPLPLAPTSGNLGLPADLLICADGNVAAVKYGVHAYDQWSVNELLDLASGFGRDAGR